MITVFADQYLYQLSSFLPDSIDLRLYDPARGLPDRLREADALLIRTVNAVTRDTLPDIPEKLSFIGTGSSGTDHVDQPYLQEQGITFADAAGCNARSVAEYVATGLLLWSEQRNHRLQNLSVGIVGVGHVGSKVQKQLEELNITTVGYDPPREKRDTAFRSASLQDVLACDILTIHTPLTSGGQHPTRHWLDDQKLSDHNFQLVINAARGGVVDEQALLQQHQHGGIKDFILDVWEDEPEVRFASAGKAFLKTPHIAGYSVQAKQNASKFITDALIDHFGLSPVAAQKADSSQKIEVPADDFEGLSELLLRVHPVGEYQKRLLQILDRHPDRRGERFNQLRAEFPLRDEFGHILLPESCFERFPILKKLGFGMH